MKLHFVLASETAAPHGALQVFGKVKHHTVNGVATGKHPLMRAVHVVVMPHDNNELFCLHGLLSVLTGYGLRVTGYGLHGERDAHSNALDGL